MFEMTNKIGFAYDSIDEAFPACLPGVLPLGSRVLCQVRSPKKRTAGGIMLTQELTELELWNTQVAKVLAVGPLAFCNRDTQNLWPEGAWCQPGDYVRVPKYAGDRFTVTLEDEDRTEVLFIIFNDLDLVAKVEDPLAIKAFI